MKYCFRYIDENGNIYQGGWEDGEMVGAGEMEYEDGTREIGNWLKYNGKHGEFRSYDKYGKVSTKMYNEDKLVKNRVQGSHKSSC